MADLDETLEKKKPRRRTKTKDKENHDEEAIPLSPKVARSREKTRGSIEDLIKSSADDSMEVSKPVKKKKKKPKDPLHETLQQGDDFQTKDDSAALIDDVHDEWEAKGKKIKRKDKKNTSGAENAGFDTESGMDTSVKTPRKKKTKKPIEDTEQEVVIHKDDEAKEKTAKGKKMTRRKKSPQRSMSKEVIEELKNEDETPKPKVRKKKKKVTESQDEAEKEEEIEVEKTTEEKKLRRKKKDKTLADAKDETADDVEDAPAEEVKLIADEGKILGITIHRTDKLKTDLAVAHPLVRVHIIDAETGKYLPKQDSNRPVTSFYETKNDHVNFVLSMMTQPYDFKKQQSTIPIWDELLLFNENFHYFTHEESKVIVFFEVLDFLSMKKAKERYDFAGNDGGWHHVAWAFLKLVGKNGKLNCDKKVRLQLYNVPSRFRPVKTQVDVYQWWQYAPRTHYPSTLYVSVKGLVPPETVQPSVRSMFATQKEVGSVSYKDLKKSLTGNRRGRDDDKDRTMSSWGRLPGQMCKIPNVLSLTLPAGRKGCFIVRFSHDGRFLACGCHDKQDYTIIIYEIPSGKLHGQFEGHYGIIYDLCWSRKDKFLLSCSGDGTARVWTIGNFNGNSDKLLPHPAFVYTAKYHPRVRTVIVTGGYDCVIRIWDIKLEGSHGVLMQELDDHLGFINTLCFDDDGQKMYSGDSTGLISAWNVHVTEQPSKKGFLKNWSKFKDIDEQEIKGSVINHLQVYNGNRRLLIHTRDNMIRTMDLRVYAVMQRYMGALNFREQIRSCVTPCGSFVISGSEDNSAYVWNTETGDQVAMYSELAYRHTVSDTDFHPQDHMVAFCSFGDDHPVMVYNFDPKVARLDAGLGDIQRPGSPSLKPYTLRDEPLANNWMKTNEMRAQKEEFDTLNTARFSKAVKKLNTVMQMPLIGPNTFDDMKITAAFRDSTTHAVSPEHGMYQTMGSMDPTMMTWGSTFDYTRTSSPLPGAFSPHAPASLNTSIQQQHLSSQHEYMKRSGSGWRPGIQQLGRMGSMTFGKPSPNISLDTSLGGRPQFTFQSGGKAGSIEMQELSGDTHYQVVALYDYQAARSDELNLMKGDVIRVLYKDNDNWWMGELSTGQQGFFPSNYVAEQAKRSEMVDSDTDDESDAKTTAVITNSGELKFIPVNESTPKKKTKNRRGSQELLLDSNGDTSSRRRRTRETTA